MIPTNDYEAWKLAKLRMDQIEREAELRRKHKEAFQKDKPERKKLNQRLSRLLAFLKARFSSR